MSNSQVLLLNHRDADSTRAPVGQSAESERRRSWWWLRVVVSCAILGWLAWRLDWQPILEAMAGIHLGYFAAAIVLYCLAQVVSSYRWKLLAAPVGFQAGLSRFVALYYVGMFFNLFLPTSVGGDVLRAWYLADGPGKRWRAGMSVLSERLSGLAAMLVLGCAATLLSLGAFPSWVVLLTWGMTLAGVLGLLSLPILARFSTKSRQLAEGMSLYRGQARRWTLSLGLSFIVQLASIVEIYLLGRALALPASLMAYAVVVPLVSLLAMLPISVNGLGVREGSLVLLLAHAGVAEASALALGLMWFCMLLVAGLVGFVVYVLGRFSQPAMNEGKDSADGLVHPYPDQGRARQPAAAA